MKYYLIYFLDNTYKMIQTFSPINDNEEEILTKYGISTDDVDYIVEFNQPPDGRKLLFSRFFPDGTKMWNRKFLIDYKTEEFEKKRLEYLKQLDLEFLISLETPNNPKTELIKRNKQFLRELSIRDEMDSIVDSENIYNLNAFNNLIDIEIINPGKNCSLAHPSVIISNPTNYGSNYGTPSIAECVIGTKGEIHYIKISKIGCGYLYDPNIIVEGFDHPDAVKPILKPIIVNK